MMDGKQVGFIAKDSLEKMPYFGKWIKAIRGVFIKRGDAREALKSIQAGVQTLKEGFSLVIFPLFFSVIFPFDQFGKGFSNSIFYLVANIRKGVSAKTVGALPKAALLSQLGL